MKYTVNEAAKIVGTTRQTIYRHIDSKPLSVEKDEHGNQLIEASELLRVYGDNINFDAINSEVDKSQPVTKLQDVTTKDSTNGITAEKLNSANEKITMLEAQLRREREVMEGQIENLQDSLKRSQDGQNSITKILEDHRSKESGAGEWEKSFKALESRIANQEAKEKEHQAREEKLLKRTRQYKAALDAERNKGFFKKLFG